MFLRTGIRPRVIRRGDLLQKEFLNLTGKEIKKNTEFTEFTEKDSLRILAAVQKLNKKYGDERTGHSPLSIQGNNVYYKS